MSVWVHREIALFGVMMSSLGKGEGSHLRGEVRGLPRGEEALQGKGLHVEHYGSPRVLLSVRKGSDHSRGGRGKLTHREKTRRQNAKRQKPTWEISQNLLLKRTSWKIAMRRYV